MDCPSCGHPNREAARFCAQCATPLIDTVTCPACGTSHPAAARHCDSCGQALTGAGAVAAPDLRSHLPEHVARKIRAGRGALEGERKQVTVLFVDVMGSMELAERTGAEEWRRIMDRFFAILCTGVHRFEGTVDKFTGDGIMALFGAPVAHEDHARRACHAALNLRQDLAPYAAELRRAKGLSLSVRMGLNSGEVVVGAIGESLAMEYTAIGHTVGLAQRVEQLAEPGGVYLTEHAASLVEGFFALTDLGEFQVKGASRPLRVYAMKGLGTARGQLDVARARGFSRFVGRDQELRTLESALEQGFGGQGQVVGIVGEAGVGKSRLCHEFAERLRAKRVPVYHVAGQAHAKSVPLLPVLQLMRDYFEVTDEDSDQAARERIAAKLLRLDESFAEDLPLQCLFAFLAVADPQRPAPRMDPEARQRQLLALMKRLSRAEHAREPGVHLFEDLHWLDPASEAFLANHVEAVRGTRSLTVLNFRPGYRAPWMSRSYYRQIAVAPLGTEASEELIRCLLGSDRSLDGLPELLGGRTAGNPFFIEELVHALVEAGSLEGPGGAHRLARPIDAAAVPATVHAILAARIDRLAQSEKVVLQAAAVIGNKFSAPVLHRVVELDPARLEEALRSLAAAEFIHEQELYPEAVYAFKHPLTREVAYESQLGERRALVHANVARAITERYPQRLDEWAALLAQHWETAGEELEAARCHARAAAWAGTSDPTQALRHWRKVRELADLLPKSDETTALGLTARILSLQFGWRLGVSTEQAAAVFHEGERMATEAGDVHSLAMLVAVYGVIRGTNDGDLREYARLTRQAIALAKESGDPALYMAVVPSAYALFCVGEYREAMAILDRAIALADGDPTVGSGISVGCPYAWCHAFKGLLLAGLGELQEGRLLIERGMKFAHEQADVETVGWSHLFAAWRAYFAGEPVAAQRHAEEALEIAERIGDSFSRVWAWFFVGFAHRIRCEWRRAIEALERSLAIASERRTAADADAWRLAVLGESYLGLGEVERARRLVEQGLELARAEGDPLNEAYARLAHARVLLGSDGLAARAEIEASLARAFELAHDTGARVFEPLVHVELAELARQSGDQEGREHELHEAHRLFTEIGATGHAERLAAELAMPTG